MNERMKGMKLGNFSGIKKPKAESTKPPEPEVTESEVEPTETQSDPVKTAESKAKVGKKTKSKQKKEQVVTSEHQNQEESERMANRYRKSGAR